ncbi:MAG TPA: hypothetical protein VHY83_11915 [Solirubrobacteraceae bacterium]|jgi:hypothetical protein|nr:hypothetical protein [Solirubrobacteraceae bacterium]
MLADRGQHAKCAVGDGIGMDASRPACVGASEWPFATGVAGNVVGFTAAAVESRSECVMASAAG